MTSSTLLHKVTDHPSAGTSFSSVLKIIGPAAAANHVSLCEHGPDGLAILAEWYADGISPKPSSTLDWSRWAADLASGDIVTCTTVDLPAEEKDDLRAREILAIRILPLCFDGQWLGTLRFEYGILPLDDSTLPLLQATAASLAVALQERRNYQAAQQELERTTKDFEQFAYSASHDLQEPLRMVSSFMQLLSQRYQGQLDERADKYIMYAVDGANRMQELIQALLAYSRVGTKAKTRETVALDEVLAAAMTHLQQEIAETGATITRDQLPTVLGDDAQLGLLMQNLLSNALKFRSEAPLRIHVSAHQEGGYWKIGVADNGIGIDPKYTDRIFLIFQRLHSRIDYPGTGIGLAICTRIVERHGGTIWVESQPAHGSTFYFTIPVDGRNSDD